MKFLIICIDNDFIFKNSINQLKENLVSRGYSFNVALVKQKFNITRFLKLLMILSFDEIFKILKFYLIENKSFDNKEDSFFIKSRDDFDNIVKKYSSIIVITSPYIFNKDQLKKRKIINIHCGLLPNFRGMYPVFWSLYEGNYKIGYTIHEINEKIDEGKLIFQKNFSFNITDKYTDILIMLYESATQNIFSKNKAHIYTRSINDYYKAPNFRHILFYRLKKFLALFL